MLNDLMNYYFSDTASGFSSINIMYRIAREGEVVRSGQVGSAILCRDMSRSQRKMQKAFNALSSAEKQICVVKFMPYDIDGKRAHDKDRARFIGMAPSNFSSGYRKILRKLKKLMSRH